MSVDPTPTPERSISLDNLRPEGIKAGPDSSTVFVSQITYGGISSVDIETGEIKQVVPKTGFLERGALGIGHTGDAFIVPGGRPVPFGFSEAAVYVYNASTGEDLATCFPLVGDEGFMNDIAIVDGKAYITDSSTPNLMVLDVDKAVNEGVCDVSSIPLGDGFTGIDFPGANGIVPYGTGLLVGATSTGAVYFLDLTDDAPNVSEIEVISPGEAASLNGMFVKDNKLFITQLNNAISVWNLIASTSGQSVGAFKVGEIISPMYRSSAISTIIDDYIYTTNLRLDIGLPAPGEEDLSTFEEDFDIVVVRNEFSQR